MRRFVLAMLLLAAPTLASAQTLKIALRQDLDTMDPTLATTYVGRIVYAGMCDKLFDIDAKLNIVPQLAAGYEWTDPKTLVIHLRSGVSFQDGEAFDADAVKATLERYLTMPGSYRKSEIALIDHIDIVDPMTIRIGLKAPSGAFLAQLTDRAGMILAPKVAAQEGKDFAQHPVCAGPFKFVERVPQDHVTLERYPGYWDSKNVHFDRVVYQVLVDSSVRLANLKAGAIDLSENIAPTDAAAVKADPKLTLVTSDSLGYFGITNNIDNGPAAKNPYGQSALVRQAFSLAIDRQALVNVVYNGMYEPTVQAVPSSSPFYDAALKVPARDVAKAKALLKQAGVTVPVKLELLAFNNPDVLQTAEVIQSMATEAGFDVQIKAMEFASSLSAAHVGQYQAYLIGWSGRVDIDGNTYSFLHSGQANNDGHYSNPVVDKLLDEGRGMTDVAQRKAVYAQMWPQLEQDLPITYLWVPTNIVGMSAKLTGFRPIPDGMIRVQGLAMSK
ncbi:MAG TPA: ABC transporter substrate-binding protein [Acetobacteraceae bacterium]|jgi:peptide/nickel transport system substrate-binding protein|nr:ABC transporter substrate-binding protein [Acetobacteraceae bacterium]